MFWYLNWFLTARYLNGFFSELFCGIITIISKLVHQYRDVIYRNTGAVHCINGYKYEIFEAIHYEIFMPGLYTFF